MLADHKHRFAFFVVDAHHAYHFIVASVEHHAAYAGSVAPHGAHCAFAESDGATVAVGHDDFVRAVGECHADHAVVVVDVDRVHTVGARARVLGETSLLDHAALRGEDHIVRLAELLIAQLAHVEEGIDAIVRLDVEHVLDGTSLRLARTLLDFVNAQPVATAFGGEEQHRVVHRGMIDVLDEVLIAGGSAFGSDPAAALRAEFGQRCALDVAEVADGDHHFVVRIEVFGVEIRKVGQDFGLALVAIGLFHLQQFVLNHLLAEFGIRQNLIEVGNALFEFVVLAAEFLLLQTGELRQTHLDDGLGLHLVEREALHQALLRLLRVAARLDDGHHFVDIVRSDDECTQNVLTFEGFAQVELRATDHHIVAVLDEMANAVFEREELRTHLGGARSGNGHQGDAVHGETRLESRHLIELVEHHIGVLSALHVHDDAHTFAVRLVIDVGDALYLAFFGQLGDRFHQFAGVRTIRHGAHHDAIVQGAGFDFGLGTQHHASATGFVGTADTGVAEDVGSRGEIGALDVLHEAIDIDIGIVDVGHTAVDDFTKVVGGHVRGHTHSDTRGTIDQERGDACGQHRRLVARVVVVAVHVHGFLLDVLHHGFPHEAHLGFRVTHGRRPVTVHRTEVTLTDDQRIAHGPRLRHTHQSAVHRAVAVGVILTEHLTDDGSRLLCGFVVCDTHVHHTVENTAMHGLEAVAHIGQRTAHDNGHRIVNIRGFHFLLDIHLFDSICFLDHCLGICSRSTVRQ